MNRGKYFDTRRVTARRKAKFIRDCKAAADMPELETLANDLAAEIAKAAKDRDERLASSEAEVAKAFLACGLCVFEMEKAETVADYFKGYIAWKFNSYYELNDTGAIGDAIETTVHLLAMRRFWRTNKKNLHVAAIGNTDVKINGVRFEVGHNAKLWNDATIEDAMAGPFDGVIYGMIDPDELDYIAEIMKDDFIKGISELASMLYVFEDKSDYFDFMQNKLGRSATIKYRASIDAIITVYNDSKHKAWIEAIENSDFPTLKEYMLNLSDNDYLSE